MVFVTHDQTEAMTLADRIVVMNQQRIEQVGTPSEIYSDPATLFRRHLRRLARHEYPGGHPRRRQRIAACACGSRTVRRSRPPCPRRSVPPKARCASACGRNRCSCVRRATGLTNATVDFVEFMGDKTTCILSLAGDERLVAL